MLRKILTVIGLILVILGLCSPDNASFRFPITCLVIGGVILFILYETSYDDDDYI